MTDQWGEVHQATGAWLPLLLGPQCLVGIERLPDSPTETKWSVHRTTNLSEVMPHSGVALPNFPRGPRMVQPGPPAFHGPPSRRAPRSYYGGSQPAVEVVIPIVQKMEYRLGGKSADGLVTIKKHYELKVATSGGEPSPLNVTGDGTLLYDSHSHLVRSLRLAGKLVCDGKDSTVVAPFTYTYEQIDPGAGQTLASSASSSAARTPAAPSRRAGGRARQGRIAARRPARRALAPARQGIPRQGRTSGRGRFRRPDRRRPAPRSRNWK